MAANDYYNPRPEQPRIQPYSSDSYGHEGGYGHGAELSAAPSYTTQPRPYQSPVSPFEGPFDDHVYPARPQDSQNSFGQDSAYYGQGGGGRPQDSTNSFRDDIPLQNQGPKLQETDHVYDAPEGLPPPDRHDSNKRQSGAGRFFKKPKGKIAWVVYILTTIQVAVFIAEIVKNAVLTGSPIMIHPQFNPMIGPSNGVLINMGARYVPCMHNVDGVQNSDTVINWPCPNTTTSDVDNPSNQCTLADLCGFSPKVPNPTPGGTVKDKPEPNQWFRFILPMFLHAGIIHIGFNMLLQVTLGREMEQAIGPIRFLLVYLCSGIFGFVLGGNFAAAGIASTGASGSLFGIIALTLLDLLYTWKERPGPWKDLGFIALDVVISFVLGLLPGLDNFSHIGGFLMGLVLGVCILHSPVALRRRIDHDQPPYTPVDHYKTADGSGTGMTNFVKAPLGFFKGRKTLWWVWWIVRAVALLMVFIFFILLLNNFYVYRKTCSWCKYLSCLPVNNWCEIGNLQITDIH